MTQLPQDGIEYTIEGDIGFKVELRHLQDGRFLVINIDDDVGGYLYTLVIHEDGTHGHFHYEEGDEDEPAIDLKEAIVNDPTDLTEEMLLRLTGKPDDMQ